MKCSLALLSAAILICAPAIMGCGGGGSDDSNVVLEGTVTEAGGAESHQALYLRHGVGARIGNVEVCALGECSTTDDEGQWGFAAPDGFNGGDVQFSINGHGIAAASVFTIPPASSQVFLDLQHVEGGKIEARSIVVDGVTSENGGHDD